LAILNELVERRISIAYLVTVQSGPSPAFGECDFVDIPCCG